METKNTTRQNKKKPVFASPREAIQVRFSTLFARDQDKKDGRLTWIASLRSQRRVAGFTLVELIVVITILVILGTIAFLNLGNFSSGARDSGRVSDLTNISKGLDLLYIKNGVVLSPESGTNAGVVNLYASGVLIGQQWAVGSTILSAIKMGGDGKDPVDKKSYTYLVNTDRTKYQVLALLEDSTTITSFVPNTYADYTGRYPATKGASLGVLLGSTGATLNQPIQENYSASTFTGVELFTATGGLYNAVLSSKTILSGTGNALLPMVANLDTSAGTYPGCDTPNIRLPNGQVWAACNVGASKAYTSQVAVGMAIPNCNNSTTDCASSLRVTLGSYFQWGRNEDVTNLGTGSSQAATGTLASAVLWQFITGTDWLSSSNDQLWGWSGTTATAWTFLSQGSPSSMQGPCASWYHIPTQYEWWTTINTISSNILNTSSWQNDTSISTSLRLPRSGNRSSSSGTYGSQGVGGNYWSSSSGSYMGVSDTRILPVNTISRSYGFLIRCLKN